jgi:hypothetical protein
MSMSRKIKIATATAAAGVVIAGGAGVAIASDSAGPATGSTSGSPTALPANKVAKADARLAALEQRIDKARYLTSAHRQLLDSEISALEQAVSAGTSNRKTLRAEAKIIVVQSHDLRLADAARARVSAVDARLVRVQIRVSASANPAAPTQLADLRVELSDVDALAGQLATSAASIDVTDLAASRATLRADVKVAKELRADAKLAKADAAALRADLRAGLTRS